MQKSVAHQVISSYHEMIGESGVGCISFYSETHKLVTIRDKLIISILSPSLILLLFCAK